jgi:alkylation response protein AidB-like acyl-CoA dehydrogenase
MAAVVGKQILTEDLLERIGQRAAQYDRENRFFTEDLAELSEIGYLKLAVPTTFGGYGLSLPEVVHEQRRLAARAPATALALNMHIYWTGAAADIYHAGDSSANWILEETAAGEIFASGHGEPGNDAGLANSLTRADPLPNGGYRFTGRKVFTSLAPVWTRLGVHGRDDSDSAHPHIVHAFIKRGVAGQRTVETWDALGLRATRSDDTVLDGAVAEPAYVLRVLPAGPPVDGYINSVMGWALPLISSIYAGIAERAFHLAVRGATQRKSLALEGKTYAELGPIQGIVADAAIILEGILAHIEQVVQDWTNKVNHGAQWPAKLFAAKQHAVEGAKQVVDFALKIEGAGSLFKSNELERLYRDVRAGAFHPPNVNAVYDVISRTYLGLFSDSPSIEEDRPSSKNEARYASTGVRRARPLRQEDYDCR